MNHELAIIVCPDCNRDFRGWYAFNEHIDPPTTARGAGIALLAGIAGVVLLVFVLAKWAETLPR